MRTRLLQLLPLAFAWAPLACDSPAAAPPRVDDPTTVGSATPPKGTGGEHKYGFEKPPGPIAGRWVTSCPVMPNMVIDIAVDGKTAVGRIVVLGDGGRRHYSEGDEILHLTVNDFGRWVGKLHYRTLAGWDRQDPINFVATPTTLDATMTTDDCFKGMLRAQ
jgi:hypothetical protein